MSDYFITLKKINRDSFKWKIAKDKTNREDVLIFLVAESDYETAPPIKRAQSAR